MQGPARLDSRRLERAFDLVAEGVRGGLAPSAVLAVATGREVVRLQAYSAGGEPVDSESVFLLASITKPILATVVVQLAEEGRLVLDEPVRRYLPEFDRPGVTAWHLLTHTSGLGEVDWPTTLRRRPERAVGLEVACARPLDFAPGERVQYSTLSYYLLAEIVARLGGKPYPELLRERVFSPLGMADTSFDPREGGRAVPVGGIAAGEPVSALEATDFFVSFAMPGGGLWSTAADLVAYGQAMMSDLVGEGEPRLLSPAYAELMTREHTGGLFKLESGRPEAAHYGLGWRKSPLGGRLPGSGRVFEHDGATGSLLWVDPECDLVFVYLTSAFDLDPRVQKGALQAVYGALRFG